MTNEAAALKDWYGKHAKPFLLVWSQERVEALDSEIVRLSKLEDAASRRFQACFLGNSGVGKSTLINILVDDSRAILPQGGVGPLTALATRVQYAPEPYLAVTYHKRNKVNQLRFALERHLGFAGGEQVDAELDEEDKAEVESAFGETGDGRAEEMGGVMLAYQRQALLMIAGSQFDGDGRDLQYLTGGLRLALGLKPRTEMTPLPDDAQRIARLTETLQKAKIGRQLKIKMVPGKEQEFRQVMTDHAAGFLAPLVRTVEVGWNAEVLRDGLTLVDLPGLGIANDEYRAVTMEEIRKAKAVVMVVDRSGVTEVTADLLRSTGFLNGLLFEDADAEPVSLIVAAVKLDLSADDEKMNAATSGIPQTRRWVEYFDDVCHRAEDVIRGQLHDELKKILREGATDTRADRQQATDRVLASMRVFPVSAHEHRKFFAGDEDSPPRIRKPEQSRIPKFREALVSIAKTRNDEVEARLQEATRSIGKRTRAAVEVIRASWESDQRAEAETEALRKELEGFLAPKKKELLVLRASYREFLRETMKSEIKSGVRKASADAKDEIVRKLRKYHDYHWSTLRAAVRKGGYFDGARTVNFPEDFAMTFEEYVVITWKDSILIPLRRRTKQLGDDYSSLVEEVVTWAKSQGARVNVKLVEALSQEIREQVKQFATVGREMVEDLRENVKQQLLREVEAKVRARCQKFVNDQLAEGRGVKGRMLEFFAFELTKAVVDKASEVAEQVLTTNYEVVSQEVLAVVRQHEDPLEEAASQILSRHKDNVRRADRTRVQEVLAAADKVLASYPLTKEV